MNDRFTPSAIVIVLLLIGGTWLANAHTHVSAQVERITVDMQAIKASAASDHDRLSRIEAQLEYVARLALIGINDHRAAVGKPALPDEFPRGE